MCLVFHSVDSILQIVEISNFDKVLFITFVCVMFIVLYLRNLCLSQDRKNLSPMFSSGNFVVLDL